MAQMKRNADTTYWHPAFFADLQIELKDDADNLIFENEHQLGKKPMEIDVLVIKKAKNRPVKKNIGKIFRKHNIIEYKGPGDSLSVDDFYKVYGYTCFYKADVSFINSISINELTITLVSETFPRKLIQHLKTVRNYHVMMVENGIYSVTGDIIPIQIIVTCKLSEGTNLWLKSLTDKLNSAEKADKLIDDYLKHSESNLHRAVFETIVRANQKLFEEVNDMSDIIMEIVQEKFDRKLKEEVDKQVKIKVDEQVKLKVDEQVKLRVDEQVKLKVDEQVKLKVDEQVKLKVDEQVKIEVDAVKREAETARLTEKILLIQKKRRKSKSLNVIADELEVEVDEILPLYNIISENPEKTAEEIAHCFHSLSGSFSPDA